MRLTQSLFHGSRSRIVRSACLLLISALVVASVASVDTLLTVRRERSENDVQASGATTLRNKVLVDYKLATTKLAEADALGADTTASRATLSEIRLAIFTAEAYVNAGVRLKALLGEIEALIVAQKAAVAATEAEKLKGGVSGLIKEGATPLAGVKVAIKDGATELATSSSGADGRYSVSVTAGSWTLTASKSGHSTYSKSKISVAAQQTITLDFSMTKTSSQTSTPPPSGTGTLTNGDSQYELKTVLGYSAHVATFNLASGQFKISTDTGNDSDCADGCATKSLSSYVSSGGGFAGMNGTYFCPSDYASCAGQTGSFFWKVLNTRLGKMINATNGLGEEDPFIAFNSSGTARYFTRWSSYEGSGFNAVAGINCKPALISGGANILDISSLDDKQRTTKSNRGAIGLKGQTLYLVIAKSATVVDLAGIMHNLEVDYALNVDGGGSSAMMFNNSYKAGPGRGLPNAIVIARQ